MTKQQRKADREATRLNDLAACDNVQCRTRKHGELRDAAVNFDGPYVPNFTTASYMRFPCHNTAYVGFPAGLCLQTAVNHLSKSD